MNRIAIALTFGLFLNSALAPVALAQAPSISEQDAHAIGVDAYLYLYSLVTMDVTRKQLTNIEPGKEIGRGPMNMFNNAPEFPPANFRAVVRPNFDTLYSIAWLDLTKEPVIVSVPDTGGPTGFPRPRGPSTSPCGSMTRSPKRSPASGTPHRS